MKGVAQASKLVSIEQLDVTAERLQELRALPGLDQAVTRDGVGTEIRCSFANGVTDVVVFNSAADSHKTMSFVRSIWTELRREFLQERSVSETDKSNEAMLWLVSRKFNAGIMVVNDRLQLLKVNDAGRVMLATGHLVRESGGHFVCARSSETLGLREAIREMTSAASVDEMEYIIVLRGANRSSHVPMSLSAFPEPGNGDQLFLVMIPKPPEEKRIEGLLAQMGLTPSEARVAALIRAGLSNREAAEVTGLSVETLNTYVKRVLSKLNVSRRSDMAQMLTWQASLERSL